LHRRKIDDNKAKKILANVMLAQLGGAPIIQTELDANAVAPDVHIPAAEPTPATPVVDEIASSVIKMMGGGEVVNA
jgi:hypothetical protein